MAQYYLETHRQQQHQEKFVALVSNAVDALVPLLNKEVSHSCLVHTSLAQSNLSYANTRPKCHVSVVTYGTYASEMSEYRNSKFES